METLSDSFKVSNSAIFLEMTHMKQNVFHGLCCKRGLGFHSFPLPVAVIPFLTLKAGLGGYMKKKTTILSCLVASCLNATNDATFHRHLVPGICTELYVSRSLMFQTRGPLYSSSVAMAMHRTTGVYGLLSRSQIAYYPGKYVVHRVLVLRKYIIMRLLDKA